MRTQERSVAHAAQTRCSPISNTPVEHVGDSTSSTPAGEQGRGLNFLDILSDCVDCVDFHIKCDQIAHGEEPTGKKMSEKKCRFCS